MAPDVLGPSLLPQERPGLSKAHHSDRDACYDTVAPPCSCRRPLGGCFVCATLAAQAARGDPRHATLGRHGALRPLRPASAAGRGGRPRRRVLLQQTAPLTTWPGLSVAPRLTYHSDAADHYV